ncbi:hypothetical protein K1719_024881 [Acacia pycnantha]|nr:hypothetical protein K1719_024881 [Acacia pycnantha]
MDQNSLKALSRLGFDSIRIIPSVVRSGGMALAWHFSRLTVNILEENRQFFRLECKSDKHPAFLLTTIYAIPHSNLRSVLWDHLIRVSSSITSPWCVLGDFNDIRTSSERIGGRNVNPVRLQWFQNRINDAELIDLGSCGPNMTWRGPRLEGGSRIYEHLDRGLVNSHFLQAMPESFIQAEPIDVLPWHSSSCFPRLDNLVLASLGRSPSDEETKEASSKED